MQTSEFPSLLDDAGFLAEIERFDRLPKFEAEERPISDAQLNAIAENPPPASPEPDTPERVALADPVAAAFERTLPASPVVDTDARRRAHSALERALEPEFHQQQRHHPSRSHRRRVPAVAVVLVSLIGIVVGAGAAAVVFHDRIAQVVVQRLHLR
jgi:hypothetical protein